MHDGFPRPRKIVEKKYDRWEESAQAIIDRQYNETLLFCCIHQKK